MNLEAAVNNVFNKRWLVESTKISLSLLHREADNLDVVENQVHHGNSNWLLENTVCFESHPIGSGIVDLLYGTSRIESGELFNMFMGNTGVETTYLSTADIAELLYQKGTLTIKNPADAIQIYDDTILYLNTIDWCMGRSVHYKSPPAEDIEAFNNLANMIEELALRQDSANKKPTTIHDFFSGSFQVVSGEAHAPKPAVVLNGSISNTTSTYKGYRERDYDFNKR